MEKEASITLDANGNSENTELVQDDVHATGMVTGWVIESHI